MDTFKFLISKLVTLFNTAKVKNIFEKLNFSKSSLIGLALLNIHRNICISDDMVLDKFDNCS